MDARVENCCTERAATKCQPVCGCIIRAYQEWKTRTPTHFKRGQGIGTTDSKPLNCVQRAPVYPPWHAAGGHRGETLPGSSLRTSLQLLAAGPGIGEGTIVTRIRQVSGGKLITSGRRPESKSASAPCHPCERKRGAPCGCRGVFWR